MSAWIVCFLAVVTLGAAALIICAGAMAGLADRRAEDFAPEPGSGSQPPEATAPSPPNPPPGAPAGIKPEPERGDEPPENAPKQTTEPSRGETSDAFPSARARRPSPPTDKDRG